MQIRVTGEGEPFVSDEGNRIVDCDFSVIPEPKRLATNLNAIPGVVEHGLFIGIVTGAVIARAGGIETMGNV